MADFVESLRNVLPAFYLDSASDPKFILGLIEELATNDDNVAPQNSSFIHFTPGLKPIDQEVMSQLIWCESITFNNPFEILYRDYLINESSDLFKKRSSFSAEDVAASTAKVVAREIFEILPFIENGDVRIVNLGPEISRCRHILDEVFPISEFKSHLAPEWERPNWDIMQFGFLGDTYSIEYSPALMYDFGLTAADVIGSIFYPDYIQPLMDELVLTKAISDVYGSTPWVTHERHWKYLKELGIALPESAKIFDFTRNVIVPDTAKISAENIMKIRADEVQFASTRRVISSAARSISALPGDEGFLESAGEIFDEVFSSHFKEIDRTVNKSSLLSNVPRVTAAVGCAFSSVAFAEGPIGAALLAAMATALGMSDLKSTISKKDLAQSNPYFGLWAHLHR